MLVSTENLYDVLEDIKNSKYLAIDTETLGISSFKGDSLFSIIIFHLHPNASEIFPFTSQGTGAFRVIL